MHSICGKFIIAPSSKNTEKEQDNYKHMTMLPIEDIRHFQKLQLYQVCHNLLLFVPQRLVFARHAS